MMYDRAARYSGFEYPRAPNESNGLGYGMYGGDPYRMYKEDLYHDDDMYSMPPVPTPDPRYQAAPEEAGPVEEEMKGAKKARIALSWDQAVIWLTDRFTAHGIPRIFDFDYALAFRLFWILLVLACGTFLLYGTINLLIEYFGYPNVSLIEYELETERRFPKVVICPTNSFLTSETNHSLLFESAGYNATAVPVWFTIASFSFSGTPAMRDLSGKTNVSQYWDPAFVPAGWGGACAVFNSNGDFVVTSALSTLMVLVALEPEYYANDYTLRPAPLQGWTVAIVEPEVEVNAFILGQEEVVAPPGYYTSLKVDKERIDQTDAQSPKFSCDEGTNYSFEVCLYQEAVEAEVEKCNCSFSATNGAQNCLALGLDREDCIAAVWEAHSAAIHAACQPACTSTQYEVRSSAAFFISSVYFNGAFQTENYLRQLQLEQDGWAYPKYDTDLASVRETMGFVSIQFNDLSSTTTRRELKYSDWYNLFEKVGGLWSFWMGFSITTLIELCMVPLVLLLPVCQKRKTD